MIALALLHNQLGRPGENWDGNRVLPLVHSRPMVERLLQGGTRPEREEFYHNKWDTWRWQLMFRIFFSRFVMGRMGRAAARPTRQPLARRPRICWRCGSGCWRTG